MMTNEWVSLVPIVVTELMKQEQRIYKKQEFSLTGYQP